jgi:hypothetical protein
LIDRTIDRINEFVEALLCGPWIMKTNVEDLGRDFLVDYIPRSILMMPEESFPLEIVVRHVEARERVVSTRIDERLFTFPDEFFLNDFGHKFIAISSVENPFVPAGCHFTFFGKVPLGSVIEVEDSEFGSARGEGSVEFPCPAIDIHVFDVGPITPPFEEEPAGEVFVVGVGGRKTIYLILVFRAAEFDSKAVDASLIKAGNESMDEFDIVFYQVALTDEDEVVIFKFFDDVIFGRLPVRS